MKEELAIVASGILLVTVILVVAYFSRSISCDQKSVSFQDARYGLFSGCMVKHNDKWLPLENIRGFDDKG